jgi:hypothetical protein
MRKLLSTFSLLCTIVCFSQKKTEKYIVPDIILQINCGVQTDEILTDYAHYGYIKDYKTIRANLNSSGLYRQLLSAIYLSEMANKGKVVLTETEMELISKIKSSQKLYAICHDDVSTNGAPINELFNNKAHSANLNLIKNKIGIITEE